MNWLLPEHIADALPLEAAVIESLRQRVLGIFRLHGFSYVMPPLLEYLDSLLTGTGQDLELKTFKLIDQLSGRSLGLRADITPQVARIDAHLINAVGITRLCYCGSVLHTLASSVTAGRELQQIGAEIYGHAGLSADIEIIRLMGLVFSSIDFPLQRIDLNHVGIFSTLVRQAGLSVADEEEIMGYLQQKDSPALAQMLESLASPYREAFLALPRLYGQGKAVLEKAAVVFAPLGDAAPMTELKALSLLFDALQERPLSFDLSDLRGYHYHNGVVFSAYGKAHPAAIARGGRYDGAGQSFGRVRAATGFSFDLREIAGLLPLGALATETKVIFAPLPTDQSKTIAWQEAIDQQRAAGYIVVEQLGTETPPDNCDRLLVWRGKWLLEAIEVLH